MSKVYVVVSLFLAFAALMSAIGKLTKNPKVVTMMTSLGVPSSWLPRLAGAEIAGAVGLVVGLKSKPIGIAAAVGLVGYFVGAVLTHVKAKEKGIGPAAFLAVVAVASVVLRIATKG
jgi:uncharacterized membrane protein YphA (DoxX/SURF4 family)